MATGFTVNGVDLDDLFAPRAGTTPVANTGFTVAGQDLADRFRASTGGDQIASDTGFTAGGTDLRQLFRRKDYMVAPVIDHVGTTAPKYEGEQVMLAVQIAAGTSPISVQWYRPNGTPISGATDVVYYWTPTSYTETGTYSVTLTNAAGSASGNVYVEILEQINPPVITSISSDSPHYVSESVTISVTVSGTGPFTYQWSDYLGNPISGATSSSYSFTPYSIDQSGSYSCRVTNAGGADTASIYIAIDNPGTAPSITSSSGGGTITAGQTASFSVTASGTAPLSYSWSGPHGTHSGSSWSFTAATGDSGTYTCTVSNGWGSDSETFSLTVNAAGVAPSITGTSGGGTVTVGQTASFSVSASGTAPLSYQWKKNGSAISGATSSSYSFTTSSTGDSGSYSCTVTNAYGNATSSGISLTVNAAGTAPSITGISGGGTVTVGQTASFSVSASGTAPLSYQWKKNGSAISGATSSSYSFTTSSTGDSGSYSCTVTNAYGSATSSGLSLTVNAAGTAPSITAISGGGSYPNGAGVTVSSSVVGGTVPITLQWYHNGSPISGATSSSYSFTASSATMGSYMLIATNAYGTDSESTSVGIF